MRPTLLIATPCFGGQVSSLYARSVLNFQMACLGSKELHLDSVVHWGDSLITRARQGLITQFLGHPTATHLLFVDPDVGFWPDQVIRLLKFDADLVASAVPRKDPPAQEGNPLLHSRFDYEPLETSAEMKNGFIKAKWAGTGMMLVKRSALESMVENYKGLRYRSEFVSDRKDPRFFSYALFNCLTQGTEGKFLNEDESFCYRWTQMGGEIWVDIQSPLTRMGFILLKGEIPKSNRL